jgi:hypothetical protein
MAKHDPSAQRAKRMPAWRIAVALFAAAVLFAPAAARAQTDAELQSRLVGTWREARTAGCQQHRQQVSLQDDGQFEASGVIDDCGKVTLFVWRGTWAVRNFRFSYVTTYANVPERFPQGTRVEDEIISVTADEWVMLEQGSGQRSVAQRVK